MSGKFQGVIADNRGMEEDSKEGEELVHTRQRRAQSRRHADKALHLREKLTTHDSQGLDFRVRKEFSIGGNSFAADFVRPSGAIPNHVNGMLHVHMIRKLRKREWQ